MCGRFWQVGELPLLRQAFQVEAFRDPAATHFNVAPGQRAGVLVNSGQGITWVQMQWGLIPHWAKDPGIGRKMINARAETITEKPSYKRLFRHQRCLVPCGGFYEWKSAGKFKTPYLIRMKSRELFGLAGLWGEWRPPQGPPLLTFTIITTAANKFMRAIHARMPVIIPKGKIAAWLDPLAYDPQALLPLLQTPAVLELEAYPVSKLVNLPKNDSPDCIQPLA